MGEEGGVKVKEEIGNGTVLTLSPFPCYERLGPFEHLE